MTIQILRQSLWDPLGDVLGHVLKLLSQSDLHALSLVSKDSNTTTERFLYTNIQWTWFEDQPHRIAAFLRTILRRPELAAYVRSVALIGDLSLHYSATSGGRYRSGPYRGSLLPEIPNVGLDISNAVKVIELTRVPYARIWEQELRNGTMDAFAALLLSQLHNLRHLVLGQNIAKQSRLIGMLLTSALCEKGHYELPTFQHLQGVIYKLDYYYQRTLRGEHTADVLPLFYLPEIQYLLVSLDNPITFNWPMSAPPNSSKITSLDITLVRETHLSQLLLVTPHLKTLRWGFYYCEQTEHASNTSLVDLDTLGTALSHVRNTLEKLIISAKCDHGDRLEDPLIGLKGNLKVLVDFYQLKKLEIPLEFLTASFLPATAIGLKDVVPRHIHCLVITDDLYEQWEQNEWDNTTQCNIIALWLQDSMALKPNLQTISLLWNLTEDNFLLDMRETLAELCGQYRIESNVDKRPADM